MANNKRPQSQKPRLNKGKSQMTLDMILNPAGGKRGQVPSGTVYSRRPKHVNRGWSE